MHHRLPLLLIALLVVAPTALLRADDEAAPELRVTRTYDNVDVRTVISDIAKAAKANIVVDEKVAGKITVDLKDVPWKQALRQIVRSAGYTLKDNELYGVMQVSATPPPPPALESDYHRFQNWRPTASLTGPDNNPVMPPIMQVLLHVVRPDGGNVRYIPSQNTAIYTGTPAAIARVKALLAAFEGKPKGAAAAPRPHTHARKQAPGRARSPVQRYEALLQGARTEAAATYFIDRIVELKKKQADEAMLK